MIRRHSLSAVCMHWFNAFCWIALLFTGFALLSNPAMQPVGMWWADLWTGVFGAYGLLVFHLLIGSAWLAVYFLYIIFGLRHDVVPFLKEVFSLSPASDMIWCVRKGMRLVLGEKAMRSMGLDPTLPPQGFYNAGQKLAAVAAVLCAAPAFADGKMNLNTATEQELSANPAVGPELAKGIVEFRENVGDIKSMDELLEVKGVTPEVLEKLKQAVTVEAIEGAECSC